MNFEKIKLLMWKNYKLRRYRWFMSLIELLLPIGIIYVFLDMTSNFSGNESTIQNATIPQVQEEKYLITNMRYREIFYTPANVFTTSIMTQVATIAGYEMYIDVKPVANESELELRVGEEDNLVGIVFMIEDQPYEEKDDRTSDIQTPPISLAGSRELNSINYKIRMSNADDWSTNQLYPTYQHAGPAEYPYYITKIATLQMLVNQAIIRQKQEGLNNEIKWTFQEFPYPEYYPVSRVKSGIITIASIAITLTVLIGSVCLIKDVIEEKDSGVKELMKLVGVGEGLIWVCWFFHSIMLVLVSYTISTILLKYPLNGSGTEVIHVTSFPVLWSLIMLFVLSNVTCCFTFCAIFHKSSVASSVFTVLFMLCAIGPQYLSSTEYGRMAIKLSCLFPATAFGQGFARIRNFEAEGITLDWSSSTVTDTENGISLLYVFIVLLFDMILYSFLAFYISAINPGKYGAPRSPFFIFECILSKIKQNQKEPLENLDETKDEEHFEAPPSNMEATLKISDLYKNFGNVYAVKGVNLNIYKGEITALLGHNGAGKTTTMSILTGLTSATAGSVYYKGLDILTNMSKFRPKLGMCPQEDRLFPYLTVIDHLLFFGMGATLSEAKKEAMEYLRLMEMDGKTNARGRELSGGMKRKLCLSISLMGKAEVLILDEPTSGMDVQSRRKLWDLLLSFRGGNRSIILTTHYMEEADALGDRIAIMHHGSVVCHGTGMFLKKVYGAGYYLTVTKAHQDVTQLTQLIQSSITESSLLRDTPVEVVYKLPLSETNKFPALFQSLENQREELGIKGMGVDCTTMEQVFLKVGGVKTSGSGVEPTKNENTLSDTTHGMSNQRAEGLDLILQQISALFIKKFLYTQRSLFSIFFKIVIPTCIALLVIQLLARNGNTTPSDGPLNLTISTYPNPRLVMLQSDGSRAALDTAFTDYVKQSGGSLSISKSKNIVQDLLDFGRKDLTTFRNNFLMACEISKNTNLILYNPWETFSMPIAVNTFTNSLLRSIFPDKNYFISTVNHPVKRVINNDVCSSEMEFIPYYIAWFVAVAFYTIDMTSYVLTFVNMELLDGFKHIQMMSNVSPFIYWLGTLSFDVLFFLFSMGGRLILYYIVVDLYGFLGFSTNLAVLLFVLVLFGISGILFMYLFSFISNSKEGSHSVFIILNIVCAVITLIIFLLDLAKFTETRNFDQWILLFYVTKCVILFVAPFNYSLIFMKILRIWYNNNKCDFCGPSSKVTCEEKLQKMSYLEYASEKNPNGLLWELQFLCIDIILYSIILRLINSGYIDTLFNCLKIHFHGDQTQRTFIDDEDVKKEKEKVQHIKSNPRAFQDNAALLVDGLKKTYNWFKPFAAVKDVTFVVKSGECFGLLGVNGAGKTTTFKMLTTEILPSAGVAAIDNVKFTEKKAEYLSMAGYCAQTNCFIEELTGREMLTLIASLRGIKGVSQSEMVDKWIKILGLQEYQNRRCGSYSGGNKRKLCTAMSLIGDPRVVFLDEPTSGVDPVSRRKLYDVMEQGRGSGQAVVLTSHSMEECENLCDRLTIMASGVMKCIGTAQHLKQRFAQGFSVLIKIADMPEDADRLLEEAKSDIVSTFTQRYCILKDEHKGLLYYQIKDISLPWSLLFQMLERLKSNHRVIEDYTLTDTSLEEVFISFSKES